MRLVNNNDNYTTRNNNKNVALFSLFYSLFVIIILFPGFSMLLLLVRFFLFFVFFWLLFFSRKKGNVFNHRSMIMVSTKPKVFERSGVLALCVYLLKGGKTDIKKDNHSTHVGMRVRVTF